MSDGVKSRPAGSGRKNVQADDHSIFAARFENGVLGSFTASWVTPGRKMQLEFELIGTRGALVFSQERFNEVHLYAPGDRPGRAGYRTLLSGPDTPPYGNFCPAPGHGIGFNDFKVIEIYELMESIAAGKPVLTDMEAGAKVGRIMDAVLDSADKRAWVSVG